MLLGFSDSVVSDNQEKPNGYLIFNESKAIRKMSRRAKQSKQKKKVMTSSSQVDTLFNLIEEQILHGDYTEAIASGERLFNYLPPHAALRADALAQLATAHAM